LNRLDEIEPISQDESKATFAPLLIKPNGLIDWNTDAVAIERRVRGFQPWPNAYSHWKSHRLIVWKAMPAQNALATAAPGEVITAHGDDLIVSCGKKTSLRLLEVQMEGKRRMVARDFVN